MNFASLGLCQNITNALSEKGYIEPTPIQAQAIPPVLEGRDVMAAAQTGTGKTAGFVLPILEKLSHQPKARANQATVLILTPTRELAAQVADNVAQYSKNLSIRHAVVFGGVGINPQMMKLRRGVEVLVATPGRLLDLYNQNAVKFQDLNTLVLDEADRMLDMGFIHDIKRILKLLPAKRQNLLFSATFSDDVRQLANTIVNNPVEVSVAPPNKTADAIEQWVYPVDKNKKGGLLSHVIDTQDMHQVLVFSRTKHGANRLAKQLTAKGLEASAIHGNKSQGARTKALADFKQGKIRALVATDIAARGLDISQLPFVINFDLPNVAEDYVHRIGRTGRAGATGKAISFVCAEELDQLKDIQRLIGQVIPRAEISGFEPNEKVPEVALDTRPMKPKKAKKPRSAGHSRTGDGRNSDQNADPAKRRPRRNRRSTAGKPGSQGQ
ncbi:DEAD/DEAH box helicase [Alteromonas oceanisediminis]|uniref:DEAD/DEAH box helicase n=1 Tax=Alteromonas oceanisediminis TaxID=2836180 RepID=UPI001BDAE4FC|nr:DEAD/DEAH box helicase [Alteromonas oceanisediminis]MBT0585993.1 DEAD/DEAH box helicase [Alteromonas oceanisediminis]